MRYLIAGESHGPQLTSIIEGLPAGLKISKALIDADLRRRQSGYGRGVRQSIETDTVSIVSGIRHGKTLGSPIALIIKNDDWPNWDKSMSVFPVEDFSVEREVTPRPGHADLVGLLKYDFDDCRNVLECASARETASRVAVAGVARQYLAAMGVGVFSYVTSIGSVRFRETDPMITASQFSPAQIETSEVRCPNEQASREMIEEINRAKKAGESLGGTFRVVATGLVPGIGGYATPADRLTSKIGGALFSIPAIKGVEFGLGFESANRLGSQVQDEIVLNPIEGFSRTSNNAGGLEGGMTTGMPLIVTCGMKPIPTLMRPLTSINTDTLEVTKASCERSDVCAVPSASVVAEAEMVLVLAAAYLDAFGSDNMTDALTTLDNYKERLRTMAR